MLTLIATPIGHPDEITVLALKTIQDADVVICESTKETSKLLRHHKITGKKYEILDEHSDLENLKHLVNLCRTVNVVLMSDCGTPAFCDPGSDLVAACRAEKIVVKNCLGPSALMGLISLSGLKLNDFWFRGFVPQETGEREKAYVRIKQKLETEKTSVILMDTPYRLQKMISEMELHFPKFHVVLATDLGTETEEILTGPPSLVRSQLKKTKAEFMLLLCPSDKK